MLVGERVRVFVPDELGSVKLSSDDVDDDWPNAFSIAKLPGIAHIVHIAHIRAYLAFSEKHKLHRIYFMHTAGFAAAAAAGCYHMREYCTM